MRTTFCALSLVSLFAVATSAVLATPCSEPTFTNSVNIPGPAQYQTGLTFADFNNDGHKDALFSNENNETISLRLGDGLGGYSGSTNMSGTGHPWGLAAADFNHDGNMDFVAAAPPYGVVHVRFGNGSGGDLSSGTPPLQPLAGARGNGRRADPRAIYRARL